MVTGIAPTSNTTPPPIAGVADVDNGGFDCRWRRELRVTSQASSEGVQRQWQTVMMAAWQPIR